ncbi:MAG TPA: hypothetical protein VK762_15215 [Polyangiaceae bacterium]|jgi:hypothetical protein|nr:hypothetical protein [Polyangiaceae bacterium]
MPSTSRTGGSTPAARYLVAGVLGLAAALSPRVARAQDDAASDEPAPGISVHIGSVRPGTSVAIERTDDNGDGDGDDKRRVVSRCFDDCEAVVDPGSYRLRLIGSDGQTIGTKGISVRKPMTFHVLDTSPSAANTGLVLGISGAVLAASGLAALGLSALGSMCEAESCSSTPRWVPIYALISIPIGVIATSIGWPMFALNRRLFRGENVKEPKKHKEREDRDARYAEPAVRFGLAPTPTGVTGGFALSF